MADEELHDIYVAVVLCEVDSGKLVILRHHICAAFNQKRHHLCVTKHGCSHQWLLVSRMDIRSVGNQEYDDVQVT